MTASFAAFVILAEMRTGSNHLQDSLNALSDVSVHGEVFNPAFIGQHNRHEMFGMDMAARQADPHALLDRIIERSDGLPGFRYFGDHDPRVRDRILHDDRIGKVILTRDPLESYVSWKIAQATDQWRLTNPKMARSEQVTFDGAEFEASRARQARRRADDRRALQRTGQAAFAIDYSEIKELEVVNGLASFLGSKDRLAAIPSRLKRQNPGDIGEKVTNPHEMAKYRKDAVHGADPFQVAAGPSVPRMMAAATSPVLILPLPGGPEASLRDWLTALDGAPPLEGMRQKALRDWLKAARQPTTLCIVRHPLSRLHRLFWRDVLEPRGSKARDMRRILANQHHVPVPRSGASDADYDVSAHRLAFTVFVESLPLILGGQTSLSVPQDWRSQSTILAGMSQAVLPHRIAREEIADPIFEAIASELGRPGLVPKLSSDCPMPLDAIIDEDLMTAAHRVHRRDYLQFGFRMVPWN